MYEVGQKVRVKSEGVDIAGRYGGREGVVIQTEDAVGDDLPEGAMEYQVHLHNDKVNDVELQWFNDYELEAVDG